MSDRIRVLIVDDDALVRSGLRMMLSGNDRIEVVAEAQDGSAVLAAVDAHRPDVVLMDLRTPKVDGLAATELLREQSRPPHVLVLTRFDADELVLRALRAGAEGFVLKDTPPAEILRAIEHGPVELLRWPHPKRSSTPAGAICASRTPTA